jgi:hypothetical protein
MAGAWVGEFLAALGESPNVSAACRAAGVSRKTAYQLRGEDEEFRKAWDDAVEESTDNLVGEAYRRAYQGTVKPVYQGGEHVGSVREYSDTLTIFLLKAHRRAVYGDKGQVDVTSGGQPVQTVVYMPENGREASGDPTSAGAPGGVPL